VTRPPFPPIGIHPDDALWLEVRVEDSHVEIGYSNGATVLAIPKHAIALFVDALRATDEHLNYDPDAPLSPFVAQFKAYLDSLTPEQLEAARQLDDLEHRFRQRGIP
jgi:hypothetical protein